MRGWGVVPLPNLLGDYEIFTKCQAPWGDAKSAKKIEIIHLVCCTPLLQDFFVKNIGILYAYDF